MRSRRTIRKETSLLLPPCLYLWRRSRRKVRAVGARRICWQIENWHILIMAERVGHIGPIKKMWFPPHRFNAVLSSLVILTPAHLEISAGPTTAGYGLSHSELLQTGGDHDMLPELITRSPISLFC